MYKNILIAIDLSNLDSAKYVVDTCLKLTEDNPQAIFRVVTIIEPMDDSFISAFLPKNFDKSVLEEANKALHKFTEKAFPKGAKVQHIVSYGTIYEEINHLADEKNVDLIVMLASSQPNAKGLSANTVKVARNTDKPVLILR
ncbi:universal stress protein [Basfia succiniciproducens]|uniref:Nucleotide-binding universal stress protein, UspA family n=1 Tax=Basfia succiniciproducens TaxID=653940 RepID=A0A1G5AT98_9PAST|nr:universal stress protein [Basfia succiniciproducens]QIM69718.1 universal stress protein UspA [Basfia succiniciproducens]SCX81115.1 Nucleotide-binding universal stress protein, UspA family [Basfia succiniciproducens]SEQ03803.1 Nucleotide-binding universal stress protein, UspA family [Basfia succiniciproducens]